MQLVFELYIIFLKIGTFTVGGGYAMIPLIQRELVDVKKYLTEEEMSDYLALAQSLPGVIGINTATAVGYHVAKLRGAVATTLGMITPSIFFIVIIAMFFNSLQSMLLVQRAFAGVRATVVALIALALVRMAKTSIKGVVQIIIFVLSAAAILFFKISPPYVILAAAAIGIVYGRLKNV